MIEMQYYQLKDLLQALVQTWGTDFQDNLIEPILKYVSIPQVARVYPWRKIVKPFSKDTVVDTKEYSLPYDFDKFLYLKTKYGELTELTPGNFHFKFPDRTNRKAQDFGFYCVEEYQGVQAQISTAELVTVQSSDASDTATVLLRGEVGSYEDAKTVTLNGTTAVSSTKTFTSLAYATKSEATNGFITIKGATSGTTLTVIPPEHLTSQYKRLVVDTSPQEVLTMAGEYLSLMFKPVNDYDVLRIPADLVLLNALSLLGWERRDVTNQLSIEKKYQSELALAIKYERKSYSINSGMELKNESRKAVPDDYPLTDR